MQRGLIGWKEWLGALDGCRTELLGADQVLTRFCANVTVKVKAADVFQTQQVTIPAHIPVWLCTGQTLRSGVGKDDMKDEFKKKKHQEIRTGWLLIQVSICSNIGLVFRFSIFICTVSPCIFTFSVKFRLKSVAWRVLGSQVSAVSSGSARVGFVPVCAAGCPKPTDHTVRTVAAALLGDWRPERACLEQLELAGRLWSGIKKASTWNSQSRLDVTHAGCSHHTQKASQPAANATMKAWRSCR